MDFAQEFVARPPEKGFHSFCGSKIEMKSQRATFRSRYVQLSGAERHRRSDSGAAVRLTRGGKLGCVWFGRENRHGFPAALGRAVGRAFAVRRTVGPAAGHLRCPGPDAAARTQQNWAELLVVVWVDLLVELLRPNGLCGPAPPRRRPATRRSRVESCRSSRVSGPLC